MKHIYQRTVRDKMLRKVDEVKVGSWIHLEEPTRDELEAFSADYNLEEGLLTDAIDPYEVVRLEIEDKIPYFFCRIPSKERRDMSTIPFMVAIHPQFVLSVSPEDVPLLASVVKNDAIPPTTQKIKFVIVLLSEINKLYSKSITTIRREVNRIRVTPAEVTDDQIIRFIELENDLNEYLSALLGLRDMHTRLNSGLVVNLFEDDKDLIEDLILDIKQLTEGATNILRNIVNIREAYSVISTNKLNRVIHTLTIMTVLLTVPTIITSFFGMNVPLPFSQHRFASLFIFILSALIMAGVLLLLKKRKWL